MTAMRELIAFVASAAQEVVWYGVYGAALWVAAGVVLWRGSGD